ncbi:MAG: hypothetical protein P0111_09180 [Nitrospira sp.]|nr:hypothetical protein [Nitrospira sp.]
MAGDVADVGVELELELAVEVGAAVDVFVEGEAVAVADEAAAGDGSFWSDDAGAAGSPPDGGFSLSE